MIQSWENLVTDGQTERRTDETDFIGCCPAMFVLKSLLVVYMTRKLD